VKRPCYGEGFTIRRLQVELKGSALDRRFQPLLITSWNTSTGRRMWPGRLTAASLVGLIAGCWWVASGWVGSAFPAQGLDTPCGQGAALRCFQAVDPGLRRA